MTSNELRLLNSRLDGHIHGLLGIYLPLNEGKGATLYDYSTRQQYYDATYTLVTPSPFTIQWSAAPADLPHQLGDFLSNDLYSSGDRSYHVFDGVDPATVNMANPLTTSDKIIISTWFFSFDCALKCAGFEVKTFGTFGFDIGGQVYFVDSQGNQYTNNNIQDTSTTWKKVAFQV